MDCVSHRASINSDQPDRRRLVHRCRRRTVGAAFAWAHRDGHVERCGRGSARRRAMVTRWKATCRSRPCRWPDRALVERSEEHTSELQSLMRISYAVFCLKKKKSKIKTRYQTQKSETKSHN